MRPLDYTFRKILKGRTNWMSALGIFLIIFGIVGFIIKWFGEQMKKKLTGKRCQCSACGLYFNSLAAFDLHRIGTYKLDTRGCLSEASLQASGARLNESGYWVLGWKGIVDSRPVP